jgi:hypothetical protein
MMRLKIRSRGIDILLPSVTETPPFYRIDISLYIILFSRTGRRLFCLSTAGFSGMTTTTLASPKLNEIVTQHKIQFSV